MSASYAREDEEIDINDSIEIGDLSDQQVSDVLDPARKVPFIIKKASIRKQYANQNDKTGTPDVTRLSIDAAIGADGLDGEGKFANKHLFCDLILAFNREVKTGDWWEKRARGPAKQFFQALGYDVANLPRIDAELLGELGGKEFVADILRKPMQEKTGEQNEQGKDTYRDTGEFKNELSNFRKSE
jgi:hypothetical protein